MGFPHKQRGVHWGPMILHLSPGFHSKVRGCSGHLSPTCLALDLAPNLFGVYPGVICCQKMLDQHVANMKGDCSIDANYYQNLLNTLYSGGR